MRAVVVRVALPHLPIPRWLWYDTADVYPIPNTQRETLMQTVTELDAVRHVRWQAAGKSWGLVPTMGALHAGHMSLVQQARRDNDRVAVSIFVNPIQFNNADDLARYPRDPDGDRARLAEAGVDLVWTPTNRIMYPPDFKTLVDVVDLTAVLEGEYRPGHFRGVTTVVCKLLNVFQPTRAYFGEKDAQQLIVIQRMVTDLAINTTIVPCPTVRESDGLALSSRNAQLSPDGRAAAPIFYRGLRSAEHAFRAGTRDAETLRALVAEHIATDPRVRIEYISVADPHTLQELHGAVERALVSGAVYVEGVRLIDNVRLG